MDRQNPKKSFNNSFNISSPQVSRIFFKKENNMKINKSMNKEILEVENMTKPNQDLYSSFNNSDLAKVKKFNSYSNNVKYNTYGLNRFYVMPILDKPKKIIKIMLPENESELPQKNNYHVENYTFKVSPRKYQYKPYKPPKRKKNLNISNSPNSKISKYSNNYNNRFYKKK